MKRGSMSIMKRVLNEGGRAESGQRRVLEKSKFWPKKRAFFLIQENQEALHEHSTLVRLIPNLAHMIESICRISIDVVEANFFAL